MDSLRTFLIRSESAEATAPPSPKAPRFLEGKKLKQPALPRVRFYCGTFALQEALFGVENDDRQAFQDGIATYV